MTMKEIEEMAGRLGATTRFSYGQIERFLIACVDRNKDELEAIITNAGREGASLEVLQMALNT